MTEESDAELTPERRERLQAIVEDDGPFSKHARKRLQKDQEQRE